jgi:hypothetical protein
VADLVDPPGGGGGVGVASMARDFGGPEQKAEEEDACENAKEEPLHADAKLCRVLESEVRQV